MTTENDIKGILVTFFRDGTKGDYLEALNIAVSQLTALTEANKITSNTLLADSFVGRDEEDAKVIAEAKKMWNDTEIPKRKLKAVKYMMEHGWGLKVASDYCQQNFG